MNQLESLNHAGVWILVGLLCIGAFLFFGRRRAESYNKFVLEGWCDCILRGMFLEDDGMPSVIQKRNIVQASTYFESIGAKVLVDVSENCLVVSHRGRQHRLSITDV